MLAVLMLAVLVLAVLALAVLVLIVFGSDTIDVDSADACSDSLLWVESHFGVGGRVGLSSNCLGWSRVGLAWGRIVSVRDRDELSWSRVAFVIEWSSIGFESSRTGLESSCSDFGSSWTR